MPRDLSALFVEENAKLEQSKLLHLITMQIDDETSINIVDSNYDITYGGVLYVKFPVAFSDISANSDGSIAKASMTVANVSREMQAYVEQHKGLRNRRVTVKTVYEKFVDYVYTVSYNGEVVSDDNPDQNLESCLVDEFLIDSYSSDETVIQFQLDPVVDLQVKVPRRRYTSNSCYWKYKDEDTCGYTFNTLGSINLGSNLLTVVVVDGLEEGQKIDIEGVSGTKTIVSVNDVTRVATLDSVSDATVTNAKVSLKYCEKSYDDCKKHLFIYIPSQTVSGTSGNNYVNLSTISDNDFLALQNRHAPGDKVIIGSSSYVLKSYSKTYSGTYQYRIYFTTNLTQTVTNLPILFYRDNTLRIGGFMGISGVRTVYI